MRFDPSGAQSVGNSTPVVLFAFGSKAGPRAPRAVEDFGLDNEAATVGPERPPLPRGASTFADVQNAPLTGHYHRLDKGTTLSEGLAVVADDAREALGSSHPLTHHTIYPQRAMPYVEFVARFNALGWKYAGKK